MFVTNMIAVGEETGQVEGNLLKVADSYERETDKMIKIIRDHFELTPHGIIAELKLRESDGKRYTRTAAYGHFGRTGESFTWEKTDQAKELRKYVK